jgi:hypothetical protein
MKKYLLSTLLVLSTCLSFGNTKTVPDWDKPLSLRTDPPISTDLGVVRSAYIGGSNIVISTMLDRFINAGERWKCVVSVRTSINTFPGGRQWVDMLYTIYTDPGYNIAQRVIYVPTSYQYQWASGQAPAGNGDYVVDGSQYYFVSTWEPA